MGVWGGCGECVCVCAQQQRNGPKETNLCAGAAALLDPVAEPPVTEGDAARGGQEEEGVDDEDQRASRRPDVGAVHGPANFA